MKLPKIWSRDISCKVCFFIILLAGIAIRAWRFGAIPGDLNQDEAYGGYEAYCILHYGADSWGYRFPVYLTTWGSGMSALNTYLMIPFVALFGLKIWVIRIPNLLIGCLTIPAAYSITRDISNRKAALFAAALVAISPWHIALSRWGLDCNLAPGFLLFGLCFFLKGLKKPKYFILSALMYGLSLYCYATIWPFVPLLLALQIGYGVWTRQIRLQWETMLSVLVLFLLALPLMLFVAVNIGLIDEILLPFLSIPRLSQMRSSEIGFSDPLGNLWHLKNILVSQTDGIASNTTDHSGIFYYITLPFFVLGFYYLVRQSLSGFLKRRYEGLAFLLIQLLVSFVQAALIYTNINRINSLFLPMILTSGIGICWLCDVMDRKMYAILIAAYAVLFVRFGNYYFTEYDYVLWPLYNKGLAASVETALSMDGTIYITPYLSHSQILFLSQTDPKVFQETVIWKDPTNTQSFDRFVLEIDTENLDEEGIYIFDYRYDTAIFTNAGYQTQVYDLYTLAWK